MARILTLVEGETEETFVDEVLAPHLLRLDHYVSARIIGNARLRSRRGGIRPWPSVKADVVQHLREDGEVVVTTMVDYYALPQTGGGAWPGRAAAANLTFLNKAPQVTQALHADVVATLDSGFNTKRFIPFVMMHEFEALLFSDSAKFAEYIGKPELTGKFKAVRNSFSSPEEINDSPLTAPSKRIEKIFPAYNKPLHGNVAVLEIGLDAIRAECPIFHAWIASLERYR